jgi:hypothetical protein
MCFKMAVFWCVLLGLLRSLLRGLPPCVVASLFKPYYTTETNNHIRPQPITQAQPHKQLYPGTNNQRTARQTGTQPATQPPAHHKKPKNLELIFSNQTPTPKKQRRFPFEPQTPNGIGSLNHIFMSYKITLYLFFLW